VLRALAFGLLWTGIFPLALAAAPVVASPGIIGEARGADEGDFRYSEYHFCSQDGAECTVEYKDRSGETFARKDVNYRAGLHSPTLVLEDFRLGRRSTLEGEFGEDVVVDAGFDHYVRHRWEELAAGEEIKFPFLIVGRDKPLRMSAQLDQERACEAGRLCLLVSLDMWLVSLLVDPIRLVYDDQRRLTQFSGVSNIPTQDGKTQSVEINYRYPAVTAAPQGQ
jgi:hypothetical protein